MDLSQVTLTMMRYAILVAETKSFRIAAERSFVSQPALSMQLARLEELLGVTLFDRRRKPTLVTPEGERVLAQMRVILREAERLGQVARSDTEPSGTYRLGIIPTMAPTILPLFLEVFLRACPKVDLVVTELQTSQILDRLREDTLEAGLLSTPIGSPGLDEVALGSERLFAYLPPLDPLLAKKSLKQEELLERRLWVMPEGHCFRTQVLSYCGPRKGKPKDTRGVEFESGSFETLIRLVDSGLGATVLPELVVLALDEARRNEQVRPFSGTVPVRELGLVTGRRELHERTTARLLSVLREGLSRALGKTSKKAQLRLDPLAGA